MSIEENEQKEDILPKHIQRMGFWGSLAVTVVITAYLISFAAGCVTVAPKELELTNILLFSLACLLFFGVPWHSLGLSLKKFGPLEFERKLEGQSVEHIKDISVLEEKLASLEAAIENNLGNNLQANVQELDINEGLKTLVIQFLSDFDEWAFSPLRIENWGSKQEGYEGLAGNTDLLRRVLRKLVAEGILETRVSKKGNTLYRIKNKQ